MSMFVLISGPPKLQFLIEIDYKHLAVSLIIVQSAYNVAKFISASQ